MTGRISLLVSPTLVSSKSNVKLPYSPQPVVSAAAAIIVRVAEPRTNVLNPVGWGLKSSKEGNAERGVCRIVLVDPDGGIPVSVPLAVG